MFFLDTTKWVAVGAAIGSTALAIGLSIALLVLLLRARRERAPDEGVERVLRKSNERFEQLLESLSHELGRARDDLRRSYRLSGLASTIDLDALGERIVEAALELPGADAALVVVPLPDEEPLLVTARMSREEAEQQALSPTPETSARALALVYRYPEEAQADLRISGGVAVPLPGGEAPVGTLAVFWRGREREPSKNELDSLEELALGAGPAVENAVRYRAASRLADLDALTGLHNRRYFHDALARECARASRYDRKLALLLLDVDDFKAINDRIGHLAGDTVLAALAERVRSVVRTSDAACRVGGDEFAVILPESGLLEAEQLYRRLELAVETGPTGSVDRLRISAGIAELEPGDDRVSLFERADEALYRAKKSGKAQAVAAAEGADVR